MRRMLVFVRRSMMVVGLATVICWSGGVASAVENAGEEDFESNALALRKIVQSASGALSSYSGRPSAAEAALAGIAELDLDRNSPAYPITHGVTVRLSRRYQTGDVSLEGRLQVLEDSATVNPVMGVETLRAMSFPRYVHGVPVPRFQLVSTERSGQLHSMLLPVSGATWTYPLQKTGWPPDELGYADIYYKWIPYGKGRRIPGAQGHIPMGKTLEKISELFIEAGLYDLAWRVQCEAAYPVAEGGLPAYGVPRCLVIAKTARLAGQEDIAWGFLYKAAAWSDERWEDFDVFDESLELAKAWQESSAPTLDEVSPEKRRECLREIIELYMALNVHPRGLALIDEYGDLFEDKSSLRKRVENGWREAVAVHTRALKPSNGRVTIYGTEVYPDGDPMEVKIPWAFSEASMEKVRQELKARASELREQSLE